MGYGMFLCLIVAAYVLECSSASREDVTLAPKDHHTHQKHRKSIGSSIKRLVGTLRQTNTSVNQETISNFTQLVMNFVNTSYGCGSEEAQKVIPQILRMMKSVFKLPFADFIVDAKSQEEVIKALEACIEKRVKTERKRKHTKKRHRNRIDETEWRAFFTGAFENADPKDSEQRAIKPRKPNRTMTISFKSILEDIMKAESVKSKERSKEALMKIILEIDDYLRKEKKKYRQDARFKRVSNRNSKKDVKVANDDTPNRETRKDIEDSINTKSNGDSRKDEEEADESTTTRNSKNDVEEDNDSKSSRDSKKNLEKANDSTSDSREFKANSGAVELKTSDEVVLNQNMEITVRMNGDSK